MKTILALIALAGLAVADFSGTYKGKFDGEDATLTLTQTGDAVKGKISVSGFDLPMSGTVSGDKVNGDMTIATEKLPFRGTLSGADLTLEFGEYEDGKANYADADKVTLKREGGASTISQDKPKEKAIDKIRKAAPTGTLKDGTEYTHATGGKFRYPKGWRIREDQELGAVELIPPDPQGGEKFWVVARPSEGATDPASADVQNFLDMTVQELNPGAKKVGKTEACPAGNGKGAVSTWDAGAKRIRCYTTILKGYGAVVINEGPKDRVEARDAIMREIFFTLGWGQGKVDAQLVGRWSYYSYSQVSGRETKAFATLAADGTFSYESESEAASNLKGKDSGGNETWTGWVNSRSGSGFKGTWSADGSTLILNFEDGSSETFSYAFEQQGSAFVVKLSGSEGKPMEWSKQG